MIMKGDVVTVFVYDETEHVLLELGMFFVDQPSPETVVLERLEAANERMIQYRFRMKGHDDLGGSCFGFFANIALPEFVDGLARAKLRKLEDYHSPAPEALAPDASVAALGVSQK